MLQPRYRLLVHYPPVLSSRQGARSRGTRRIVSVNYLFGRTLIPYNFLKGIFTTNFRDMGKLRPSVFGLLKMLFRVPKKGQLRISEKKIRPKVFGKWTEMP